MPRSRKSATRYWPSELAGPCSAWQPLASAVDPSPAAFSSAAACRPWMSAWRSASVVQAVGAPAAICSSSRRGSSTVAGPPGTAMHGRGSSPGSVIERDSSTSWPAAGRAAWAGGMELMSASAARVARADEASLCIRKTVPRPFRIASASPSAIQFTVASRTGATWQAQVFSKTEHLLPDPACRLKGRLPTVSSPTRRQQVSDEDVDVLVPGGGGPRGVLVEACPEKQRWQAPLQWPGPDALPPSGCRNGTARPMPCGKFAHGVFRSAACRAMPSRSARQTLSAPART